MCDIHSRSFSASSSFLLFNQYTFTISTLLASNSTQLTEYDFFYSLVMMWCDVWFLVKRTRVEMIYDFVKIIKQSAAFWLHKGRLYMPVEESYEVVCRRCFAICCSRHHLNTNFLHAFSRFFRVSRFCWNSFESLTHYSLIRSNSAI